MANRDSQSYAAELEVLSKDEVRLQEFVDCVRVLNKDLLCLWHSVCVLIQRNSLTTF